MVGAVGLAADRLTGAGARIIVQGARRTLFLLRNLASQCRARFAHLSEQVKNIMSEPPNPLSGEVWRRGAALGVRWLALFCVAGLGSYVVLGALGWSGTARALCAMGAGPAIGTVMIALWWAVRRPVLQPQAKISSDSDEAQAGES